MKDTTIPSISAQQGKRAKKITEKSIASELAIIEKTIQNESVHKMIFNNLHKNKNQNS